MPPLLLFTECHSNFANFAVAAASRPKALPFERNESSAKQLSPAIPPAVPRSSHYARGCCDQCAPNR
jgi:hypothetical protein